MNKSIFALLVVLSLVISTSCQKEPVTIKQEIYITVNQFDQAKFNEILDRLTRIEANSQEANTALAAINVMLVDLKQQIADGRATQQQMMTAISQLLTIANGNSALLTQIISMLGDLSDSVSDFTALLQTSVIPQLAAIQQQGGSILAAVSAIGVNIIALQGNMASVLTALSGLASDNDQLVLLLAGIASDIDALHALEVSNHTALMTYLGQLYTAIQNTQTAVNEVKALQQQTLTAILLMAHDITDVKATLANLDLSHWDDDFWFDLFDRYFHGVNWGGHDTTLVTNNITYIVGTFVHVNGLDSNDIGEIVAYGVLMHSPATDNLAWFNQQLVQLRNWGYPINWYKTMVTVLNNSATQNNTIAPAVVGQILTANMFTLSPGQKACLFCHLHSDFPSLGYGSSSDCVLAGGSGCN